jgi:hypothetical protein
MTKVKNIRSGINKSPKYVKYSHAPISIKNREEVLKTHNISNIVTYRDEYQQFSYGYDDIHVENPLDVARDLKSEFNIAIDEQHYQRDGIIYSCIHKYPCVLFDIHGFCVFESEKELDDFISSQKVDKKRNKKIQKLEEDIRKYTALGWKIRVIDLKKQLQDLENAK